MIEIFVNGEQLELLNREDLNIRLNNVVYDPTTIGYTQAEYSFEFDVPSTPKNNRIFGNANELATLGKFNKRYNAQCVGSGTKVFDGQLVIKKYANKLYTCNFVALKAYNLEDIFGDSLLKDIDWRVDFSGATTINSINSNDNGEYYFPLVSYGVFKKDPYEKDPDNSDYDKYTSKFIFDQYNRWYIETFPPSHNLLTTVKKCFQKKGYTVGGDAFKDPVLKNIYLSVNLADGQSPIYNIGNPLFGDVNVTTTFNTNDQSNKMGVQDLSFPYMKVQNYMGGDFFDEYNFESIDYWNVASIGTNAMIHDSYMYQPNEKLFVVPADGFYRITLSGNVTLNEASADITVPLKIGNPYDGKELTEENITIHKSLTGETPVEIQLVKNYDNNIELIKGKINKRYRNGNPNDNIILGMNGINPIVAPNIDEWITCYPHETLGAANNPTNNNLTPTKGLTSYAYRDNETMAYDPAVSEAFICGLSSWSNGVPAVIKQHSWRQANGTENEVFANVRGYDKLIQTTRPDGQTQTMGAPSQLNFNNFVNAPVDKCSASDMQMAGNVTCTIYLKKNDVLQLMVVQRDFNGQKYSVSGNTSLHIEAVSPYAKRADLVAEKYEYYTPTTFDDKLNLANWFNSGTTMSEFVNNAINALNLQLSIDGTNADISIKKNIANNKFINYAVDIDDRINSYATDVETSPIDYPRTMAVKYKIDIEEWGFEKSVMPQSKLNDDDWADYGDKGYTVVKLNDSIYAEKDESVDSNFSYTWYDSFIYGPPLNIPVISKFSYMIPGYSYKESLKHDGFGLTQRMWFRQPRTNKTVTTASLPAETIYLTLPINQYNGVNLSYKNTEKSLLTEYFNFASAIASNYIQVEVYLTPKEYHELKNGAMVHMDDDLYYCGEITGFDPSNNNKTTLKLIKKVV